MSGSNLLLDTNAFIYFFEGRQRITELVAQTEVIYYSPISEIELLSATHLSRSEIGQIKQFFSMCDRVEMSPDVLRKPFKSAACINRRFPMQLLLPLQLL